MLDGTKLQIKVIEVVAVIVVKRGQRCNINGWEYNKGEVTKQKSVEVAG